MMSLQSPPFNRKTTLIFCLIATGVVLLIGGLTQFNQLPLLEGINLSPRRLEFIRGWLLAAIAIGIILPLGVVLRWRRDRAVRHLWGYYVLVMLVQLVTEQVLSFLLFPSIVVSIGTLYTLFRLWQLVRLQQLCTPASPLQLPQKRLQNALVWLLLFFWGANLIILFTITWPAIWG
ncbi:hypothetical protein PN462_18455 [Spirulina sp. CS-785/01]|uniref:hypothetical protein n=1 Tax=Spirulina sp. CS-785/01 TaxID=3021716 RepID=UPI00232D2981|nr:hypothetical protein [Spirulina sp. CS-785/01]MDB9315103.1 hypothetical protein [Spirulina sp. CS-785/01]